jgi:periplasmic protein TonB
MSLRCLLFSSNSELVQPIWQILADLGIEGEYCRTAVDAVEKVTTQPFHIVITDWEDQPEATFLLKTARDLKVAQRPLTLAIVSDDAQRPQALQAGANSVLLKPIRPEQARETLSTACELLRSKSPSTVPAPQREPALAAAMAAAASAGPAAVPSLVKAPEKLRAGEFLQSATSAPGAQFDTESEVKVTEEPTAQEVETVAQLEPTASALETSPRSQPKQPETLTGWAMLQARLTKPISFSGSGASPKTELLSYENPSSGTWPKGSRAKVARAPARKESQPDAETDPALFAYISGKSAQIPQPASRTRSHRGKIILLAALAVACVALARVPRARQELQTAYRNSTRFGNRVLNPPPAPLPQAVAVHDSFGQSGDEYNLPVPVNIPDATTDPSQIRVLPVVDPTAKPQKNPDASPGQEPAPPVASIPAEPDQTTPSVLTQDPASESSVKEATPTSVGDPPLPTEPSPDVVPVQARPSPSVPAVQPAPPRSTASLAPHPVVSHVSAGVSAGIPSSLKSQVASTVPQNSGSKPVEAAMSSIEPVPLPEPALRELLVHPVDPDYPAKAGRQNGTVVLQVRIGRDGTVQDAIFLQGSLIFARAAINAVKQWRFKPYSFNGRAVSVQSVITMNFRPPV